MQIRDPDLLRRHAFLAGQWVDSDDGSRFGVRNPASGATSNLSAFANGTLTAWIKTDGYPGKIQICITIETCKSIIEGLSKLILIELEQTPETYFSNPDLNVAKLFKDGRSALKKHIDKPRFEIVYEDAIVEPYGSIPNMLEQLLNPEVVARIGELRTEHGDISHGPHSA